MLLADWLTYKLIKDPRYDKIACTLVRDLCFHCTTEVVRGLLAIS